MATFAKGIRVFAPKENAPSFIKGQIIITPKELMEWIKQNQNLLNDYKGEKQLKLTLMQSKDGQGLNIQVDTYKPKNEDPYAIDGKPW